MSRRKVFIKVQTTALALKMREQKEESKNIVLNNCTLSKRESQTISNGYVDSG
jgi:flagellar motor switch protein FliG